MNRPIAEDPPGPAILSVLVQCANKEHTTIGPEDNIILVWVISALEKIEEQVFRPNINVPGVGTKVKFSR